jgi:hypothetical protein
MIDSEIFAQQMAKLADRIGRALAGPTQREYHRVLSAALTTEQFLAAMTLAFAKWPAAYRTWPSPEEIVAYVAAPSAAALSAAETFERVLELTNDPRRSPVDVRQLVEQISPAAKRAFNAAGGMRDFRGVLEVDVPWLRKRFVEAYEHAAEHAQAEQSAALALRDAEPRVAALVAGLAQAKQIPAAPAQTSRRIA